MNKEEYKADIEKQYKDDLYETSIKLRQCLFINNLAIYGEIPYKINDLF